MSDGRFRERLMRRAVGLSIDVPDASVALLETYVQLLAKWASKINLTSLPLDPPTDEAVDRLLLEPIAAAKYVQDERLTWFDLGSGGGSPALPLKIVRPQASLVMVEPKERKVAFLREAIRTVGLEGAAVEPVRFQDLRTELHATAHFVTVRALRVDADLAIAVDHLLRPDGSLYLFGASGTQAPELRGFHRISRFRLSSRSTLTIYQRVPRGT